MHSWNVHKNDWAFWRKGLAQDISCYHIMLCVPVVSWLLCRRTRMWAMPVLLFDGVPNPMPKTLFLSSRAMWRCSAPVLSCSNRVATSSNSGTSLTYTISSCSNYFVYLFDSESMQWITRPYLGRKCSIRSRRPQIPYCLATNSTTKPSHTWSSSKLCSRPCRCS